MCSWPLHTGFFDDARHAIVIDGIFRPVTAFRWKLLSYFRSRPGQLLDQEWIYAAMYGGRDDPPHENAVKVHVCHLRRDLEGTPYHIVTRGRSGYIYDLLKA